MPTDLTGFLYVLTLVIGLLVAISQALKELGYFGYSKPTQNGSRTAQTRTISLLKIEQRELSNRPPVSLSLIPLIYSFLMLAFGGWVIYMWIARIIELQMDFWLVLFLGVFIVLPLYIIVDYFRTDRKYYKLGRSRVAKEARVTVANDVDTVFDACYRVLDSMQAAISILEKPNLLKAKIRNSVMTITIIQIEGSRVRVYVLSDSKWLTIKWDRGANQRNIDNFLQELSKLYNSSISLLN